MNYSTCILIKMYNSDCISAFLWVNEQNLLALLYPGIVVIPKPAYDELSYPTTPHLKRRIDYLINNKQASSTALAKTNNGIVASNNLDAFALEAYCHPKICFSNTVSPGCMIMKSSSQGPVKSFFI